jgi:hypothetical protein
MQNYYRHAVAININKLIKNQNSYNKIKHRREWNTIKKIKQKLNGNSLMISKADKGKSIVILPIDTYKTKIHDDFIQNNQFINLQNNPTDQYKKNDKHELNKQNIIQKEHKWKYSNMNPKAPNLHATIKLYEQNTPIKQVVNWKNSPAYNLAKFITNTLKETVDLPFTYNIRNSIQLIYDLNNITINENTRICSFDTKDMYTNIPQQDATHIIHNILQNYNENVANNILNMLQIVLQQNYFQFDNQYYKQNVGLAMGAPTPAIIAETFLQNLEHNQIYNILTKYIIIGYFRYVDGILIIYDINKTHIDTIINEIYSIKNGPMQPFAFIILFIMTTYFGN